MSSFSIAYNSFKNHLRSYVMHIVAMIFSIAICYNFLSIKYYPEFNEVYSRNLEGIANVTLVLLFLFIIAYVWYSTSYLLKQRKKEIGIYAFMGMANKRIAYIFALETMFIGIVSIIIGLSIGVLFGKLFMMLLAKTATLHLQVSFFISVDSLINTAIIFLGIFVVTTVFGYIGICRSKLIDLFNASKKEQKLPKTNYIKAILAIIIIGAGYYTAVNSVNPQFLTYFLITVVLVVFGTFWLFGAFIPMVTNRLLNKKHIFYNGINIVNIPDIAYRIKENYRVMATVTILITVTITAFGTSFSMRYYDTETNQYNNPYTFSYFSMDEDEQLDKDIMTMISESDHTVELKEEADLLYIREEIHLNSSSLADIIAIKYSDFVRITKDLQGEFPEEFPSNLEKGETIYLKPRLVFSVEEYDQIEKFTMKDIEFSVLSYAKTPLLGNGMSNDVLVVSAEDYDLLKDKSETFHFRGITLSEQDNAKELVKNLATIQNNGTLYSYHTEPKEVIYGIVYFFGTFLSLVLIMETGSIIYFKTLNDAFRDKEKFTILSKIGMTKKEISQVISRQVSVSFILPLIIGAIHSSVAIYVLSKMMRFNLAIPTIISIVVYSIVYFIYYMLTTRKFLNIISSK